MGKPYRFNDAKAPAKAAEQAPAPPAGKPMVQSGQTGDPLPAAERDVPGHSPIIPWPAAGPINDANHKPMKLGK